MRALRALPKSKGQTSSVGNGLSMKRYYLELHVIFRVGHRDRYMFVVLVIIVCLRTVRTLICVYGWLQMT